MFRRVIKRFRLHSGIMEGFIENKGHNYLYAGYWKVYGHVEEKKALFNRYEEARKVLIQLLASGRSVSEMAACYA